MSFSSGSITATQKNRFTVEPFSQEQWKEEKNLPVTTLRYGSYPILGDAGRLYDNTLRHGVSLFTLLLAGRESHRATHGFLLLTTSAGTEFKVEFNSSTVLVQVYNERAKNRDPLSTTRSAPFPVPSRKWLSDLTLFTPKFYDAQFSNCKHYCANIIKHFLGSNPEPIQMAM